MSTARTSHSLFISLLLGKSRKAPNGGVVHPFTDPSMTPEMK
jgi:hypothetical protein